MNFHALKSNLYVLLTCDLSFPCYTAYLHALWIEIESKFGNFPHFKTLLHGLLILCLFLLCSIT